MSDGSNFDFVAVEDCAKANVCGMLSNATDEFYNVGTGFKTSLKELAEKLLNLTGCNKKLNTPLEAGHSGQKSNWKSCESRK